MLRNLAATLLAASLIAGPAFAAQQSDNTGNTAAPVSSATVGGNVNAATRSTQPAKPLRKHVRSHTSKRMAHRSIHRTKTVHHFTGSKTHKASVARMTNDAKGRKAAGAQPAQVPATRTN